jgi:hypothetical protein
MFVQDYHRSTHDFYQGISTADFIKTALNLDFVAVEAFSSPVCDCTMVLARAGDAQIMLVPIEQGFVNSVELHRWRSTTIPTFSLESRQFGPTFGKLGSELHSKLPLEFLSTALRLDQTDDHLFPIQKWWSWGSGAEQKLSWHHNLFTSDEVNHFRFQFASLEAIGQSRRDAIKGPWRDIFDLDRARSHYVEVPELETVLRGLSI